MGQCSKRKIIIIIYCWEKKPPLIFCEGDKAPKKARRSEPDNFTHTGETESNQLHKSDPTHETTDRRVNFGEIQPCLHTGI